MTSSALYFRVHPTYFAEGVGGHIWEVSSGKVLDQCSQSRGLRGDSAPRAGDSGIGSHCGQSRRLRIQFPVGRVEDPGDPFSSLGRHGS